MKDNQVTVAAMKDGLKAMKQEYKKLDIDKIDTLQDEMEDMLEMNSEIQDALSRQYDTPDIDEAELEAELEALGDDLQFDADTSYLDEAISAPNVPTRDPASASVQALAVHILRSIDRFAESRFELLSNSCDDASCQATVGIGPADMERNCFSNECIESEYTLENLMGIDGYVLTLSCAGQVYAKFAQQLLHQKFNDRYWLAVSWKRNVARDFRKLYEYIIEVVDSWYWGVPLQYPMPEKTQLLEFLEDLQSKMDSEWADKRDTDFKTFVEQCVAEVGRKFDQICAWYMECYLPAFFLVVDTLKKTEDFGVLFFDYNFAKVTLDDLLIRAGNNLRLPRLIIRPSFKKFRLECVRMVKPILYFPREWIGRSDHVMA
uniref:Charged multivesicular body protein 5 n=1 Tax=Globodera pallida TaxID=36090 RepID=A0A183BRR2_GLOPA